MTVILGNKGNYYDVEVIDMGLDVSFEKPILTNLVKISQAEFDALYAQHIRWIEGAADADIISISDVDLSDINLSYLNLKCAVFTRVRFSDSIRFSSMYRVKFDHCDLSHCWIEYCNFDSAAFNCCNLYDTEWQSTTMRDLRVDYSDLRELTLTGGCVFSLGKWWCSQISLDSYSITSESNSISADIIKMCDPAVHINQHCPTHGRFIGWKKVLAMDSDAIARIVCICKLEIPASAKRSSSLSSKCRADKAKVLEIRSISDGHKFNEAVSQWDPYFVYRVGEYVSVDDFDENRYNECAPGIHFFIDKQAALDY